MPGTPVIVDWFHPLPVSWEKGAKKSRGHGKTVYLLTHFHGDHYGGLNRDWRGGPLYCTDVTANLVETVFHIDPTLVRRVSLGSSTEIAPGVAVTLVDANHCPGAAMAVFRVNSTGSKSDTKVYLHTGDFRGCEKVISDVKHVTRGERIESMYLDTTYCDPKHTFAPQVESIARVVSLVSATLQSCPRTLVLVSAYNLGKERILLALAHRLGRKIYVEPKKYALMGALELAPRDRDVFTTDPSETNLHVCKMGFCGETWPFFRPNFSNLQEYLSTHSRGGLACTAVEAFIPSGWCDSSKYNKENARRTQGNLTVQLIPYSEHSNYAELVAFVKALRPVHVVPTVFGDAKDRSRIVKRLAGLTDSQTVKRRFVERLFASSAQPKVKRSDVPPIKAPLVSSEASTLQRCPACTFDNPAVAMRCAMCGGSLPAAEVGRANPEGVRKRKRPVARSTSDSDMASPSKRQLSIKNFFSSKSRSKAEASSQGPVTLQSADNPWPCPVCTYLNSPSAGSACAMCGTPRLQERSQTAETTPSSSIKSPAQLKRQSLGQSKTQTQPKSSILAKAETRTKAEARRKPPAAMKVADVKYADMKDAASAASSETTQAKPAYSLKKSPAFKTNFSLSFEEYDPENPGGIPGGGSEWKRGGRDSTPYLFLARAFEALAGTTKRLLKQRILTNLFRSALRLTPGLTETILYLCSNDLDAKSAAAAPSSSGTNSGNKLSFGGSGISWAVRQSCGVSRQRVSALYRVHGDMGDVAYKCRSKQRSIVARKPLTITGVRSELLKIAAEEGAGSQGRRKSRALAMMNRCRGVEIRWIVRTLSLHLRTGATRTSCLAALATAKVLHTLQYDSTLPFITTSETVRAQIKSAQDLIARAYNRCPDFGQIVSRLIEPDSTVEALNSVRMVPGVPVCCMLANPTRGVDHILQLQRECVGKDGIAAQYKYDGVRAQIHVLPDGSARVFSRHNENVTERFPDAIRSTIEAETAKRASKSEPSCGDRRCFIIDAEICGVERASDGSAGYRLTAFQKLSTRARKGPAAAAGKSTVPVCVFAFDLLLVDGDVLTDLPLRDRQDRLRAMFRETKGKFEFAAETVVRSAATMNAEARESNSDVKAVSGDAAAGGTENTVEDDKLTPARSELKAFLESSLRDGCEGLVVKDLASPYLPGKRNNSWLKLKPDYSDTLGDTVDVVPIGAWHGNGRKAGWFSPFLLAVYDPDTARYQTLCRCISGFSDAFYKEKTAFYKKRIVPSPPGVGVRGETPSVWFQPSEVWEIRGAELTVSPVHKAGEGLLAGHPGKGLSLRFPRFLRVRSDKSVEDTTSPEQLVSMFSQQRRKLG